MFYEFRLKGAKVGRKVLLVNLVTFVLLLSGCGVQAIPKAKNEVDATQAEIMSQYQRRSDLIPNLVNVVKAAAANEKDILEAVVSARARATSVQIKAEDAKSVAEFQKAQGELSQALGKLMMITENYPQLKSNEGFRDLQSQLEGTENRITVARNRYIESIKNFNNLVTVFPTSLTNSLFFHHQPLAQFGADKDVRTLEQPPTIDFKK